MKVSLGGSLGCKNCEDVILVSPPPLSAKNSNEFDYSRQGSCFPTTCEYPNHSNGIHRITYRVIHCLNVCALCCIKICGLYHLLSLIINNIRFHNDCTYDYCFFNSSYLFVGPHHLPKILGRKGKSSH